MRISIIIDFLNTMAFRASQFNIFIFYFYFMTIYLSLVTVIFSIVGFEEVNATGQFSAELKLGFTPLAALVDIANILFFLSMSCVIYTRKKS